MGLTASRPKRIRRKVGDILRIDLGAGRHAYAQVAAEPLVVFFDGAFEGDLPIGRVPALPVAFRLWVANHAITGGAWPVVGHAPLLPANAEEPYFWKQDRLSGRLALYHSRFAATGYERPATLAECEGLECAAVWEPEQVADRLRDRLAGRPNAWAESLRIDRARVPAGASVTAPA